jgi:hypothetical protein
MAEQNLCCRLGIVEDNEDVTEQAVQKFVDMFTSQVPSDTIAAMRALFRLDCAHADAVEMCCWLMVGTLRSTWRCR